jgi:ABC-type polar amino acid transport system ATPase subunit
MTLVSSLSKILNKEAEEIEEVARVLGNKCETTSRAKDFPQRFSGLQKQRRGAKSNSGIE